MELKLISAEKTVMLKISRQFFCMLIAASTVTIFSGCGGSSTSTDDSSPLLSDQPGLGENEDSVDNFNAEFGELLLIERVLNNAFEALISMNEVYSQGELTEPYLACVDSTGVFPLIEFDCSAAATPATLQEFGFPVAQLKLTDDQFCREQLASAQDSLGCIIESMYVQFADNWQFRTQYNVSGSVVTRRVQIFQGDPSPFVDPSTFSSTACELSLILAPAQPTVRNDEQLCRQATLELLKQTDQQ